MSTVQSEITALEEALRLAELGPDPTFFEERLADDARVGDPSLGASRLRLDDLFSAILIFQSQ